MPDPVGPPPPPVPGFFAKAALKVGRLAHQPAHIPANMTNTSRVTGIAATNIVGTANQAARDSYEMLKPRGPAKLMAKLFDHVESGSLASLQRAKTNSEVFWVPFSLASEQLGQAMVNPAIYKYAKAAGFENPSDPKVLADLTHPAADEKGWPSPPPPPPPAAPGTTPAPPTNGGQGSGAGTNPGVAGAPEGGAGGAPTDPNAAAPTEGAPTEGGDPAKTAPPTEGGDPPPEETPKPQAGGTPPPPPKA